MFTYNITFIVSPEIETKLLKYLRTWLKPKLFGEGSFAGDPELKKLVEVGGEKPGDDHGLSVALSATFYNEELAHLWHDNTLIPSLGDFHKEFGNESIFFVTLLENLYL